MAFSSPENLQFPQPLWVTLFQWCTNLFCQELQEWLLATLAAHWQIILEFLSIFEKSGKSRLTEKRIPRAASPQSSGGASYLHLVATVLLTLPSQRHAGHSFPQCWLLISQTVPCPYQHTAQLFCLRYRGCALLIQPRNAGKPTAPPNPGSLINGLRICSLRGQPTENEKLTALPHTPKIKNRPRHSPKTGLKKLLPGKVVKNDTQQPTAH